jgi:hypothetical protein
LKEMRAEWWDIGPKSGDGHFIGRFCNRGCAVSFFLRCAFCIAVVYWLSPLSTSSPKPGRAEGATAADKASLEAVITGSLRSKDKLDVSSPAIAEQAARLLKTLDAKTRQKLVDSFLGAQSDEGSDGSPASAR